MEFRKVIIAASLGAGIVFAPMAFAAGADADAGQERQSVGDYVADAALTTKVKAAIMADKDLSVLDISVETSNGVVTLSGSVGTDAEADHATTVARGVEGIKQVENHITVDPAKNKPAPSMQPNAPSGGMAPSGPAAPAAGGGQ